MFIQPSPIWISSWITEQLEVILFSISKPVAIITLRLDFDYWSWPLSFCIIAGFYDEGWIANTAGECSVYPSARFWCLGGEKRPHVGTMSSDVCISPLLYPIRFQLTGKIMTQRWRPYAFMSERSSAFVSSVRSCAGNNSQTFLQPPGTRLCNPSLHTSVWRKHIKGIFQEVESTSCWLAATSCCRGHQVPW